MLMFFLLQLVGGVSAVLLYY